MASKDHPESGQARSISLFATGVALCAAGVAAVAIPYLWNPGASPPSRVALAGLGAALTAGGAVLLTRALRAVKAAASASRNVAAALRAEIAALREDRAPLARGPEGVLGELDRALAGNPSDGEILSLLRRLLDAQRVALIRFEHSPGIGSYRCVEAAADGEAFDERHVPMAEFDHDLLARPDPFLIEDLEAEEDLPPVLSRLRGRGIRTVAGGALVANGRTVGRLLVCRSVPSAGAATDRAIAGEAAKRIAARPRTAELEQIEIAKAELGALTLAVSHDLRAPLRAIQGFAGILTESYAERLGEEGVAYAARIVAAAERLDSLLRDLDAYGKLGQAEIEPRQIGLESAVREALDRLSGEVRKTRAEIQVDDGLPEVWAHPSTLVTAIENLVGNALKFVEPAEAPRVRIRSDSRPDRARLWIEDNGIGIAPEHRDRIFGVFERLHGVDRYPGSGIGLAVVRRAAERLGGDVGVDSEPGRGSRFWLDLPLPPPRR